MSSSYNTTTSQRIGNKLGWTPKAIVIGVLCDSGSMTPQVGKAIWIGLNPQNWVVKRFLGSVSARHRGKQHTQRTWAIISSDISTVLILRKLLHDMFCLMHWKLHHIGDPPISCVSLFGFWSGTGNTWRGREWQRMRFCIEGHSKSKEVEVVLPKILDYSFSRALQEVRNLFYYYSY